MRLFSKQNSLGFSLVEMMVVVAIFFIITAVTLANLPDFQNKTSMDLVAQDVALTIRTAQVYSTATRRSELVINTGNQFPSYGMYIEKDGPELILYSGNADGFYKSNENKEHGYLIEGKALISDICYGSECNKSAVNIFFKRPNTDVTFYDENGSSQSSSNVTIVLSNKKNADEIRWVIVHTNGQIEVSRPDPNL
jgi:type II secretory pathway pseudopilin PulG